MTTEPSSKPERHSEVERPKVRVDAGPMDEQESSPDRAAGGPMTPVRLVTNPYALGLSILLGTKENP